MSQPEDPVRALVRATLIVVAVLVTIVGLFVLGLHECQAGRLLGAC